MTASVDATATLVLSFEFALPTVPTHWQSGTAFQTFEEDVVDLRASTSLFDCTHYPGLKTGSVSLRFPREIRIETEGRSIDHGPFPEALEAHFNLSVAALPLGRAVASLAFDLRDLELTPERLDAVTLIEKLWAPRELSTPPRIEAATASGRQSLTKFIDGLLAEVTGAEPHDMSPARLALFVESPALFDLVLAARAEADAPFPPLLESFAGCAQNVLDHAHQDRAETLDSLDPIFAEDGVIVIASQRILIEVARQSRSFHEGRKVVGTCPYFLLVHVLATHNEMVLRRWVDKVSGVYNRILDVQSRLAGKDVSRLASADVRLIEGLQKEFADIRVSVMIDIRSTAFQNSFRYDTEREMFDNLMATRGLVRINLYWQSVLDSCDQAISDIARLNESSRGRRMNIILAALTCVTILSVVIDLRTEIDAGSTVVSTFLAAGAVFGAFAGLLLLIRRLY
ncbi:hypothetical protein [Palleronia pelagia]|uniref:Uncharacterized protein n=1 Tax=Palleronia pelagia TaxID=387096 RepID=A0A1H8AFT1_9RHOB|nr:hypothetical protein [Palleronia pelagia]SEM68397.1 hypothetical protein SAMN04488011_101108 [Palleronia pelagia]